jgi:sugar phosphate isomerase/epimerase
VAAPPELAINQATTRPQWTLAQAIEGYARAGIAGIGIWPDKLVECGLAEARRHLVAAGMAVTSYGVGEIAVDRTGQPQTPARNRQMIDEAAALGAGCMVCVMGGLPRGSPSLADTRKRAADMMSEILPHARAAGVPLAIEPIHPMRAADVSCISTLAQATDLSLALGAGTGVVIDAYHVWWDPNLAAEAKRAGERILAFQLCDWLADTAALANDRGMMGDGVIALAELYAMVRRVGYDGPCEVEIMSERNWWRRDPDEVVAVCIERFRALRAAAGTTA